MSDPFCDRFGSILEEDAQVIEATLEHLSGQKRVRWLEVGMFAGGTGRGVRDFLARKGIELEWWGIDAGYITEPISPFPGANIIKGRSEEVYPLVTGLFDGIFIDGCHCRNHIILDTMNYGPKVRVGGFLLFHDCGKDSQGKDKQPCGPDLPEFYIQTLEGMKMMGFPTPSWELFKEMERPGCPLGGTKSFRRLK